MQPINNISNKIEISHKTVFFLVILVAVFWFVLQIRDTILLLFVSFILMSALSPVVDRLEKQAIPRILAVTIVYILFLSVLGIIVTILVPPLVNESVKLIGLLPSLVNPLFDNALKLETLLQQFLPVGTGVVKFSVGVFSNVMSIISLLVIIFYFLLERKNLNLYLTNILGVKVGNDAYNIIWEIENKLGAWVRGELALMTIVGLLVYLGLTILKIEYALPLAILAGILELIPIMGPIISAVPAVLVALSVSPGLALMVVLLYTVIQQLENSLIVPSIMKKAVGIAPLITIIALMIGGKLAGIGGALLSVPVVLIIQVLVSRYLK